MKANKKVSEVFYTICPVKAASHIAFNQGLIQRDFGPLGIQFKHISSLPKKDRICHYNHNHPGLFREGGNIPPIWARAGGFDNLVVGLNFNQRPQVIFVKEDSPIRSLHDLRGKKVLLPKRDDAIDFWRATAQRGIISALEAHGLSEKDVEFVEVLMPAYLSTEVEGGSIWAMKEDPTIPYKGELGALEEGLVDAFYQAGGRARELEATGKVRAISDLASHPDLYYRVSNADPAVITASGMLAREHPHIIVQYLETLLKAAQWAKENRNEVVRILAKETFSSEEAVEKSHPPNFHEDLAPQINDEGIKALEIQKQFLKDHGFIEKDFDIKTWVDKTFLEAARKNVVG